MRELVFRTDDSAKTLEGLNIGHIYFSDVRNEKTNEVVDSTIEAATAFAKRKFSDAESIGQDPVISGLKTLFSRAGLDTTKVRPSGEALARRVVKGKGIYRINAVVDINNSVSLLTGFPCGVYDLGKIEGNEITLLVGTPDQTYEDLQGNQQNAEGRIMTADSSSVFGGPAADSRRTSITPDSKEVLMLIYCPPEAPPGMLESTMEKAAAFMEKATGAKRLGSGIYKVG